jgi:hypothetical protein
LSSLKAKLERGHPVRQRGAASLNLYKECRKDRSLSAHQAAKPHKAKPIWNPWPGAAFTDNLSKNQLESLSPSLPLRVLYQAATFAGADRTFGKFVYHVRLATLFVTHSSDIIS